VKLAGETPLGGYRCLRPYGSGQAVDMGLSLKPTPLAFTLFVC
jgi:hypothetical protein